MKRAFILSAVCLLSLAVSAQVQRTVPEKQGDSLTGIQKNKKADKPKKKDLMRDLDLTNEQKGKIKEINAANKAKKAAIEANDQLSDAEKKSRLQALRREQAKNTAAILNAEQREKMKKIREEMRKNGKAAEMMEEDQ